MAERLIEVGFALLRRVGGDFEKALHILLEPFEIVLRGHLFAGSDHFDGKALNISLKLRLYVVDLFVKPLLNGFKIGPNQFELCLGGGLAPITLGWHETILLVPGGLRQGPRAQGFPIPSFTDGGTTYA